MATELRQRLDNALQINVPVEFFANLTLEQFIEQIRIMIESSISSEDSSTPTIHSSVSRWIKAEPDNAAAPFRLFCFPHAGGGASFFQSWKSRLPANIHLCPIQLPGREERRNESPLTQLKSVIEVLTPLLETWLNQPFAMFGHSMGGLLAFELTRELRRRGWPHPAHLFVSGCRPPQLPDMALPIHHLPDDKFITAIQRFQGIPQSLLDSPDYLSAYLPQLKADFKVVETYIYRDEAPLDCPITVFGGEQDPVVSLADLKLWQAQTTRHSKLQSFLGDHIFLQDSPDLLIKAMMAQLSSTLPVSV